MAKTAQEQYNLIQEQYNLMIEAGMNNLMIEAGMNNLMIEAGMSDKQARDAVNEIFRVSAAAGMNDDQASRVITQAQDDLSKERAALKKIGLEVSEGLPANEGMIPIPADTIGIPDDVDIDSQDRDRGAATIEWVEQGQVRSGTPAEYQHILERGGVPESQARDLADKMARASTSSEKGMAEASPEAAAPMTAEESQAMIDGFGLSDAMTGGSDLSIEQERLAKQKKVPETALQLDEWGVHKGREVLENSELMQAVFEKELPESVEDRKVAKSKRESIEKAVADMFGAAFELEPQLHEASQDPVRHEFLQQLLDTPEYHALHAQTQLDAEASELASAEFAKQLLVLKEQAAQGEAQGQSGDSFENELKSVRAVSNALNQAQNQVNDLGDARNALGIGLGGGGQGQMNAGNLSEIFKRVRGSSSLRRICELAGRYRRLAQAKQRKKTKHGRDDVVGVVLDGDVGRLVGSELAQITNPQTQLEAMRRLVERQSMCRDHRGVEKIARGPVMVFLDESGSMHGERSYTAKAIALALAWVARKQKRWVCLVAFSGHADIESLRRIVLAPGKSSESDLLDWLTSFIGGGTTLDWLQGDTMDQMFSETGAEAGKTDVVVITDGAVHFSDTVRESCKKWKKAREVKLISLVIGGRPDALRDVSDVLHSIRDLGVEQDAVGEVLSM